MGVVGAQGGVVVAEAVVCPPGFRILVLACKQQRAGAPTRPRALAIQRLSGVSLDDTGGGVDQFLWRTRQVTHQGILKVEFRAKVREQASGHFQSVVSSGFLLQQLSDFDLWGDVTTLRTLALLAIAHKA